MEKRAAFGWEGDLINRLIHRSWGEYFVNIFLDLIINISRGSSLNFACALGRKPIDGRGLAMGVVRRLVKRS
jgi:hypothetical protein